MSRSYGIALVALLVGMPAAAWAGQNEETTVVTDKAVTGETKKEKRRGGHPRLGNVKPQPAANTTGGDVADTGNAPSAESPSVTTTAGDAIE